MRTNSNRMRNQFLSRNAFVYTTAFCVSLALGGGAPAAQTEFFLDDRPEDFARGDIRDSIVTSRGTVQPPHPKVKLDEFDAAVVWDILETGDYLYVATGHDGRLFRRMHEEEPEMLHEFEESAIYALAEGPDGGVLAAASPGGKIYSVNEDGEVEVFAETEAEIIWDLLRHDGAVWAATGSPASIVRVDNGGEVETIIEFEETLNVMQLAPAPDGEGVLAVTQGPGQVLRVTAEGNSTVLLDPESEEVRRVAVLEDGSIVAAVNAIRSPGQELLSRGPDEGQARGNQQPQPESFLARIYPDGMMREWWKSPEPPIHDIYPLEDGGMIVSAGSGGSIFLVTADGEKNSAGVAREEFVTRLATGANNRLLMGTGSEAAVYRMRAAERGEGAYLSRVFDGRGTVRWGRLLGHVYTGEGEVLVSTRSGNTAKPDDNWTDWSDSADFAAGDYLTDGPISRFFQYRVEFKLDSNADQAVLPELERMRVFYRRANEPPVIESVRVGSPGGAGGSGAQQQRNPVRVNVEPHSNTGRKEITWSAEEPGGESLVYTVQIKPAGTDNWMTLEEDLSSSSYTLDTRNLADGEYRARVTASDVKSYPVGEGLQAVKESPLFLIDNTVPELRLVDVERRGSESVRVEFEAEDATSLIGSASYRPGTGEMRLLKPEDGFFDQRRESFAFTLEGEDARSGKMITLFATDENGNTARLGVTLD